MAYKIFMFLSVPRKQSTPLECFQYLLVNGKVDVFVKLRMPAALVIVLLLNRCVFCSIRNGRGKMKESEGFWAVGESLSRAMFTAVNI